MKSSDVNFDTENTVMLLVVKSRGKGWQALGSGEITPDILDLRISK
jgi:hypothetical protein